MFFFFFLLSLFERLRGKNPWYPRYDHERASAHEASKPPKLWGTNSTKTCTDSMCLWQFGDRAGKCLILFRPTSVRKWMLQTLKFNNILVTSRWYHIDVSISGQVEQLSHWFKVLYYLKHVHAWVFAIETSTNWRSWKLRHVWVYAATTGKRRDLFFYRETFDLR